MSETNVVLPQVVQGGSEDGGERYDVVVVGGGQTGLAIGYFLTRQGRRFVVLEAAGSVGAAWRTRWDSLVLFTPRRYSALPGLPFPGDPDGYPTRDEVVAYLERYVEAFALPVELGSPVRYLRSTGERWLVGLDERVLETDNVVIATGPFQAPNVPSFAGELAADVVEMHSTGYRRPDDIPAGATVLVVGGGNTGYQIAQELAATHPVQLAVGSRQMPLPQRLLGRDLFWWLTRTGLIEKTVDSRMGRRASRRDSLIGSSPRKARRFGVKLRARAVGARGRTITFADGSELDVDAVVWATGFRPDYSWVEAPVFDDHGRPRHRRGVTAAPGLYFLGLSWQHTRGSALIGFVEADARFVAELIEARIEASEGAGW